MKRWLVRFLVFMVVLVGAGITALMLYLRSDSFQQYVRQALIKEIERASGGRAEMKSFYVTFPGLFVTVEEFTLHGKEPAGEAPLFHAKKVEAEVRILSVLSRSADLQRFVLTEPRIRILSDEHGNTNLPQPKIRPENKRDFVDTLLDIKAKQLELVRGVLEINDRRVPLDLKTGDLAVLLKYEALGPRYAGTVSAKDMDITALGLRKMRLNLDAETALEHGKVRVASATLKTKDSTAKVSGFAYDLLRPSSDFGLNLDVSMRDVADIVDIPVSPVGRSAFAGKVSFALDQGFAYDIQGMIRARGLGIRQGQFEVRDAAVQGGLKLDNKGLSVSRAVVRALGGTFEGNVRLAGFREYEVEGEISGIRTNLVQLSEKPLPFAALAAGKVRLTGTVGKPAATLREASAAIALSPSTDGGRPVQGALNVTYRNDQIEASNSYLSTPDSEVAFRGILDSRIHLSARTANLVEDIQPFLSEPLPIELRQGSISFDGFITGKMASDPRISGRVLANNVAYGPRLVERMQADVEADRSQVRVRGLSLNQGTMHLSGDASTGLRDWKPADDLPLQATLDLRGARIERLLEEAGRKDIPVAGAVHVTAKIKGTVKAPEGEAQVAADGVVAYGEPIDRMRGVVRFTPSAVEVADGALVAGRTQVPFTIKYTKASATSDWMSPGAILRWRVQGTGVDLTAIKQLREQTKDVSGIATLQTDGEARLAAPGKWQLRYLQGELAVPALRYKQAVVTNLQMRAATKGNVAGVTGRAQFQGARLRLNGEWDLNSEGVPGQGTLGVSGGSLENLISVFSPGTSQMPFQSALEGEVRFRAPLMDPIKFDANVVLRRIQINPDPKQILRGGAKEQDLVVLNTRPVRIELNANEANIRSAQFTATNTRFDVTGRAGFGEKAAWDLRLLGSINMAQLQIINKDLLATGMARLDATVRGAIENPQVNGTLQLTDSSLYFGDLPTGIDNVNGSVLFDRNRATIQTLEGESGGGRFSLTGFVGFGGPALVYRLQAGASGVRVRYPEGASTTVNANLSLTGTSEDSLLGGGITIVRAGFNPRVDFASMLAETSRANAPASPSANSNEYLRGVQFDLRIESSPGLEFQTSLTKGLRAEVDLHLRGNLVRPSLLGNVAFSEGEIQLFGNRYTLNRGDIRFFNPTKIEPTFDLEAETRARGITVNVSFSGTPRKMNAAYRSDPPMQPSEIIALLATGRDPNVNAGLATSQSNTQSTLMQGVGSLVGEAVASSLNGRLQKFFGVTRIKIDPQLTGVENIPQARLTLEQQVSKDITLTYITNLTRTQEQIVRIQWDLSRQWSAIAVREENGLFGLDFQFRKRFK